MVSSWKNLKCEQGEYINYISCSICPPGYFCPNLNGKIPCPEGKYNPLKSQISINSCLECPKGSYSKDGSAQCISCEPGFYCPSPIFHIPCPAGTFNSETGISGIEGCLACKEGFYNNETRQISCDVCRIGYYCPSATEIYKCPVGTYGNTLGLTKCFECPPGYFTLKQGSTECNICPAGSYCPTSTEVIGCPPGSFNARTGMANKKSCIKCGAGTISLNSASIDCSPCTVGSYCPSPKEIKNCPIGTYNPYPYSTKLEDCIACPIGTYGYMEAANSENQCTACPPGHYCPSKGLLRPIQCPPGEFNRNKRSDICYPCQPGYYCPNSKTIEPIPCAKNEYSTLERSISCKSCEKNSYNNEVGSTKCRECPEGTSLIVGSTSRCSPCPVGKTSNAAENKCVQCPTNTFSFGNGKCVNCGGTYCSYNCKVHYNLESERCILVKDCPIGTWTDTENLVCNHCNRDCKMCSSSICLQCKDGYYDLRNISIGCISYFSIFGTIIGITILIVGYLLFRQKIKEIRLSWLPNDRLCQVCFCEEIEIKLLPCNHTLLCNICASNITRCPYCRTYITSRVPK